MCILFCHPQFHGGMFLLFLCFSSPRLLVFAEKGIFIFMIFRGGSAHLRNEMLAAGRKFFNFSAFRGGVLRRFETIDLGKVSPGRVVHDKSRSLQPRLIPAFDRSPRSLRTRGLTVVRYSRLRPPTAYILSQESQLLRTSVSGLGVYPP